MLSDAIGGLLPQAVAVALSPVPIVAVALVLGTPRARAAGLAFAFGWVGGLLALSTVLFMMIGGADDGESAVLGWLQIGIGAAFLVVAGKQWGSRRRRGEDPEQPRWMEAVDSASPIRAAILGAVLAANPKNIALSLSAAAAVTEAGLDSADKAVAMAVFVLVGSATVVGAVLFYLVAGRRAERPLAAVKNFVAANSGVILAVVLLIVGVKLLVDGAAAI